MKAGTRRDRRQTPVTHRERAWRETHERLYEAAIREIERVGFHDVRIDRICEETGISRPTFYAHFANKDGVVSELLHRFMDGISRGLEARTRTRCPLAHVVEALIETCHDAFAMTSEHLRRQLAAYLPLHQDVVVFSHSPIFSVLTGSIVESVQRREIRAVPDARGLACRFTVVIHSFFLANPGDPEAAAREARAVMQLMLDALRCH